MKSARSRPKTRSRTGDITEAPAAPDIVADGKLAKLSHLAHISLSPLNKMSLRTKRLFEQNLEGSIVKKKCTSLMSDSSMKVPVVRLHKLEHEHQKRKHNEPTPDDGSVHSKLPPSPLAHNELLASNLSITNNQQNTIENVCTSPPKECSKVPVVRLFRLNMQTETEEREPTSESDREKHQDQELQKTDKQKVPCANNSYTPLEGICRRKQPVVKLSRLKAQLHEVKLGKSSSEQYLDQVPSPSNTEALSPLTQSAILPPNTDFTRKRDQQDEDPENKGSASFETVCSKQPVVYLTRLNIETKNQCQATDEDDSEHHHDHVQSMQPEGQDEQPTDDTDSDQLDKEELKMLSAYELERLKNIKDNAKFLKSLKFLEIPASLRQPPRKRVCAIRVKSQSDIVTRRSLRLQERTLPIKIPKKKNEIEEIPEQQLMLMRMKERRLTRQRILRPYWVHPNEARFARGVFSHLYLQLRVHLEKFLNYFRINVSSFDELLQRLSARLQRQDTVLLRSISPEEKLMVTLRFLATGESFTSLHYQFRLAKSTIAQIVVDTCKALWELLREEFLPEPTTELWEEIAAKFMEITQFPNCLGAVDGKHIRIQKPPRTGSQFYNYKRYFSIILMAIADAEYRFVAVDIGAYGRTNDSRVLKESTMGQRLHNHTFNIPAPRPLPGTDGPPMPYVLVGDEAFQMCQNLFKPYPSQQLNVTKKCFNYHLSRARRFVECAFGILAEKWRIFHKAIQLRPDSVDEVIKACIILHNFVLTKEPPVVVEESMVSHSHVSAPAVFRTSAAVHQMRDQLAEYFV